MRQEIVHHRLTVILLFFAIVFLAYSNTFYASWHLDDFPNIVHNPKLHVLEFTPQALATTLKANPVITRQDVLYRPLSCLTFGINWYINQGNVLGYHLFNLLLHSLTGYLLYCTILILFQTKRLTKYNQEDVNLIAFLTAIFWLASPIQTQAVTYIIQRMAALGAFFYLFSLYFFLKTRLASTRLRKIIYVAGCLLTFLAALASKENTVTLPFAYLLIEIIFFQNILRPVSKKAILITATLVTGIVAECVYILLKILSFPIFELYDERSFSLMERILSEHRIVLFYLLQIFFPSPQRLSLIHDFTVSTSLWHPWTTLPSIIIVYSLILAGFLCISKRPAIAFAILFFFLTHAVESTILPLELIFEHRNYLPSLFLFLPFAIALQQLFTRFKHKKSIQLILISSTTLVITIFCFVTYTQNATWKNETSLWVSLLEKAPNNARPYQNLGKIMIEIGDYDKAMELYKKALTKQDPSPNRSANISFNNMANIYLSKKQYDTAIQFYNKALRAEPNNIGTLYNKAGTLLSLGRWKEASRNVDTLIERIPYDQNILILKGFILLKQGNLSHALTYFENAYTLAPDNVRATIHYAKARSLLGQHTQAKDLLHTALKNSPTNPSILLSLLEINIRAKDIQQVQYYKAIIKETYTLKQIDNALPSTEEEINSSILANTMLRKILIPAE